MTSQIVNGTLLFADGSTGVFFGTNGAGAVNTDGTLAEIKSDATYYVVSASAGNQFPGKTVVGAMFSAATIVQYAYILSREGVVASMLPASSRAAMMNEGVLPCKSYQLKSGDTIQVMTRA